MLRCCGGSRLVQSAAAASRAYAASPTGYRAAALTSRRSRSRDPASRGRGRSPAPRGRLAVAAATDGSLLGAPRQRLNEACLARNLVRVYECDDGVGPSHAKYFTCRVRVMRGGTAPSGSTAAGEAPALVLEGSGGGYTRAAAQDAAAAVVLASMGAVASLQGEEREALAWVGDASFDMLVGLLGNRRGLSAAQMDGIRQRLATNAALGDGAPGRAAATTVEASVGVEVLRDGEALRALLLAAVRRAAPALAAELEAAVDAAAAGRGAS